MEERCWQSRKRGPESQLSTSSSHKKSRPPELSFQQQLELCYPLRCLCILSTGQLYEYLDKFTHIVSEDELELGASEEQLLLGASCLSWIGDSCHRQLEAGRICPAIQAVVNRILSDEGTVLFRLLSLIKVRYSRNFLFWLKFSLFSLLLCN